MTATKKRRPYGMTVPCAGCPFSKGAEAVRLTAHRAAGLANNMLRSDGKEFYCHKTVDYETIEEADEYTSGTDNSIHCAGALIFAEKQGRAHQMMRIAERLGMYDAQALMADQDACDIVFDSKAEMVAAHRASWVKMGRSK